MLSVHSDRRKECFGSLLTFYLLLCSATKVVSDFLLYPMDCSIPGLSVLHCLLEFAQIHVHWAGEAIRPSRPLPPPSSPSVFSSIWVMCLAYSVGLWGWSTCIYFSFQSLRKQSAFSTKLGKSAQLWAVPLSILVCTQHTLTFAPFSKLLECFLSNKPNFWLSLLGKLEKPHSMQIRKNYYLSVFRGGSKSKSDSQESQLLI